MVRGESSDIRNDIHNGDSIRGSARQARMDPCRVGGDIVQRYGELVGFISEQDHQQVSNLIGFTTIKTLACGRYSIQPAKKKTHTRDGCERSSDSKPSVFNEFAAAQIQAPKLLAVQDL